MEATKQEIKDLVYKIEVNEETGEKKYFLDDEPLVFVDPSEIKVGSIVWYDPNGNENFGVVVNIRESDFIYYDVGDNTSMNTEEVAMFEVYKVENVTGSI